MLKIFYFLFFLLIIANPVYAEKSEWMDPRYDFTKAKNIYIDYAVSPEIVDGTRDRESQALFFERVKANITDKLPKQKYKVDSIDRAREKFLHNKETEIKENVKEITEEQQLLFEKYLLNNYDLLIKCIVSQYDTGKKYVEAHTYTEMVPVTTTVLDATGQFQTITIQQRQVYKIPAGDYPAAFVQAQFEVMDTKTNKSVWTLEDKRDRVDETGISGIKPKEVFTEVIGEFAASLRKNLKSRKPI